MKKWNITPAMILAHMDVIKTCHRAIADTSENRKIFEDYICSICSRVNCTGKGRCKATDKTFAQLNLLTALVSFRDEGSIELGIEGFDRIMTIGEALVPFNPILADYFLDEEKQILHAFICLAKDDDKKTLNLGTMVIPKDYNVKVHKLKRC